MKIAHTILDLKTRHDFNIARAAAPPARRNVWVRLTADDGVEGWGEAAPNAYYAESADTVVAALAKARPVLERLAGVPGDEIDDALLESIPQAAALRSAISAAFLDLIGKRAHESVMHGIGVQPREQYSSFTIGIDDLEVMREKVREAHAYRILKIKVGTPDDARILRMLRDERPDAVIRVDANTGWTVDQALQNLPMMEEFGIELIEQPLAPDDYEGLRRVTAASRIPIIADESCKIAADVRKLAGCVHGVNIKLAKCGSLREASHIVKAAREQGMQVMVGCMIESTLGIAAALQIAPLCDYVDLDGAALLANDPFIGPGLEPNGKLRFSGEPGLGVRLR